MLTLYYINLDRRVDRKNRIESDLSRLGYPYYRFTATDYSNLNKESLPSSVTGTSDKFRLQEVACALSHVELLKHISLTCETQWSIVLEDDACFPNWLLANPEFLKQALQYAPDSYDAYMLGYAATTVNQKGINISGTIYHKQPSFWGTHAIAYRKENIINILDKLPVDEPMDFWIGKTLKLCFIASPFQEWCRIKTEEDSVLDYGGLITITGSISDIKDDSLSKINSAIKYMNNKEWHYCTDILESIETKDNDELAQICDVAITSYFYIDKAKGKKYIERLKNLEYTRYYQDNHIRIRNNISYYI
jgi:hypothetical protein